MMVYTEDKYPCNKDKLYRGMMHVTQNENVNALIIGFAMFAVFFGAGNLVFPPLIGLMAGDSWQIAIAGLTVSAILFPIATIIAVDNMGGTLKGICRPVATWFTKGYMVMWIVFILTCGVPRQAGVGIESGLLSVFPALQGNDGLRIGLLIGYFLIVMALTFRPSKIVDIVGKYLTPFLLICLVVMIVLAVVQPLGTPAAPQVDTVFSYSFLQGYQTGDVAVGIAVAGMFVASIKAKGYQDVAKRHIMTMKAAVIAFIGLFVVYGGLLYLGATGSGMFASSMDQTALLNGLVHALTGTAGNAVLGLGIFLACLTTTIGVGSTIANLTVDLSHGKISFKIMMIFVCLFGLLEACIGVQGIIRYTFWIFIAIYPVSIALMLLGVFARFVPNHGAWKGTVFMATMIGLFEGLMQLNKSQIINLPLDSFVQMYQCIPFAAEGFAWVVPSVIGFIIGTAVVKYRGGKPYPMNEV